MNPKCLSKSVKKLFITQNWFQEVFELEVFAMGLAVLTANRLAQWSSVGMLFGRSGVRILAKLSTQGFKIIEENVLPLL